MEEITNKAAKLIKFIRNQENLSQTILADALNVPLRTYQNWEKNFSSKLNYLELICSFYNINLQLFFKLLDAEPSNWKEILSQNKQTDYEILLDIFKGLSIEELLINHPKLTEIENISNYLDNIVRDWYFNKKDYQFNFNFTRNNNLEEKLSKKTNLPLSNIRVINTSPVKLQILKEIILGFYGAEWIKEWLDKTSHFSLGISNGYTVSRILDNFNRGSAKNLDLFSLNFTKNPVDFSISSTSLISSFCYKHEGVNNNFKPTSELEVYSAVQLCDAMLLGIGTFSQTGLYSKMIEKTLGKQKLSEILNKKACGDLNYYIFDQDGNIIEDKSLVSAISPTENDSLIKAVDLQLIQKKADRGCKIIVAAAGEHKAEMINLSINKCLVNHLLIDDSIANKLLEY
ncbi:MAG: sugar-binding domain-containing protein [Pleomorphochaeta sp.]